jgi:hypothetical protein
MRASSGPAAERFEAAIHKTLSGELFALRQSAGDAPKAHGRGNCRNRIFGQGHSLERSGGHDIVRAKSPLFAETPDAIEPRPRYDDLLNALAAPIDANRRPEFLSAVAHELENASAIGPGSAHRAARRVISQFWSAPPDLRQGRLGPRGSRS